MLRRTAPSARRRSTVAAALACAALAAHGCSPPPPPPPDAGDASDAGDAAPADTSAAPTEYSYVISALAIDESDDAAMPHSGFNFDGLASTAADADGCNREDYLSALDPDQNVPAGCTMATAGCRGGVDNQLPTYAASFQRGTGTDARAFLVEEVNASRAVYLVRVSGVDSFTDDPAVTVRIYEGYAAFGAGCDRVAPDREYQVARSALRAGGTSLDDAALTLQGRITAGRLTAESSGTDSIPLPLPTIMGSRPVISMNTVRLRVDLSPTAGARGNFGGVARGAEIVDAISRAVPAYASLIETLVGGLADLPEMGTCANAAARPPTYGRVALGMGLALVPARITGIADAPAPTSCTSMRDG